MAEPEPGEVVPLAPAESAALRRELKKEARRRQRERKSLVEDIRTMLCGVYVPTRRPSHIDPPFRAQGFVSYSLANTVDTASGYTTTADKVLHVVSFNQNAAVPEAWNGVVPKVNVFATLTPTFPPTDPSSGIRYTVRVNGQPYPGFSVLPPSSFAAAALISSGGFFTSAADIGVFSPVPILLKPGDTMDIVARLTPIGTVSTFLVSVIVTGYIYPVRKSDDSIAGTLVD